MCGIAGILNRARNEIGNVEEVQQMLSAIKHRGPDDTGVCGINKYHELISKRCVSDFLESVWAIFGFNRLSIQDVSDFGHQPMISPNGKVVITFNGEIYNVIELKNELLNTGKYKFRSASDTEVILYLYMEYGFERAVKKLNGMFAIVLYDVIEKRLYMARDRFGIIPLHLWIKNDSIAWASEIKCFMEISDFKKKLDVQALNNAVMFCYSNNSMYHDITPFMPGTILVWDEDSNIINVIKYFDINDYVQYENRKYIDLYEQSEDIVRRCVNRQLISDVNLGVQFSGGVDSTLLAGFVSDAYKEKKMKLHGFSLTNHGMREYDEEEWIDRAASKIQINLHKFDMNINTLCENFENSIYAYERLVNIPSPIGIYEFARNAQKYVTVLISGEGADELCGGYGTFSIYKLMENARKYINFRKLPNKWKEKNCIDFRDDFLLAFDRQLNEKQCNDILNNFESESILNDRRQFWEKLNGTSFDKIRKMYFQYTLISLLERQNKVCMASSIENRVPFLDNEMVEFMFSIPEEHLLHKQLFNMLKSKRLQMSQSYEGKYILKKMSEKRYGRDFAYRNKQAIRIPLAAYIKQDKFCEYVNDLILPKMKQRGLINWDVFKKLYHNIDIDNNALVVWKAINIEAWVQMFIDGRNPIVIH